MNESMAEVGASMQANPPPPIHRRPRVREVSSRFMSPVAPSSSSCSPLPRRSISVQKQRQTEPLSSADENRDFTRSPSRRKPNQRTVVKLFKENGGGRPDHQQAARTQRPDTPTISTSTSLGLMRQRSTPSISPAAKLLQSAGMSSSSHFDSSPLMPSSPSSCGDTHQIQGNHLAQSCSTADLRSSMPEAGMRPVSSRYLADTSINKPNECSRSLDLPPSSACEYSSIHSLKAAEKPAKHYANSVKLGGLPLPPSAKPLADVSRKGRKIPSHQEDAHYLRLLHNHYLQWRYANAKADASITAQTRETERTLYSLIVKMSELYDSVKRKRIELGLLKRAKTLSTILEVQIPYLEQWSTLEADYTTSLLEAIQALLNASLRLPISGNVRADAREVREALNSAVMLMESIAFHVQKFMPKAEEMEILVSELARISGGERSLVEECGDLLSMTYRTQEEECSLRGQIIQLNRMSGDELYRDEQ